MYMEHRLGIKLAIINVGEVPPVFLPLVQEVKARLKSKKTENKMLTFMFRASPGDVPTEFSSAWVAVSGEGNAHKSAETSTRLAGLPIQFVPYLPEMPEDNSPPTDPVINFLEYPNRKLIFNRFMIFVTNALKSDGSFNEDIAGMFHLTPPLIEHIRRIKDFLRSPGLIPAYRAYLADPAIINAQEYDIPLKFLQLVAWQCYNDDIFF